MRLRSRSVALGVLLGPMFAAQAFAGAAPAMAAQTMDSGGEIVVSVPVPGGGSNQVKCSYRLFFDDGQTSSDRGHYVAYTDCGTQGFVMTTDAYRQDALGTHNDTPAVRCDQNNKCGYQQDRQVPCWSCAGEAGKSYHALKFPPFTAFTAYDPLHCDPPDVVNSVIVCHLTIA